MVGFATTATFRAGAPRGAATRTWARKVVEKLAAIPGPKVVVFQDLDDPLVAATFGEVMATTYKAFGCRSSQRAVGRDLDQVEPLCSCFTSGTICYTGTRRSWNLKCRSASAECGSTPAISCTATATASRRSRTNSRPWWLPRRLHGC